MWWRKKTLRLFLRWTSNLFKCDHIEFLRYCSSKSWQCERGFNTWMILIAKVICKWFKILKNSKVHVWFPAFDIYLFFENIVQPISTKPDTPCNSPFDGGSMKCHALYNALPFFQKKIIWIVMKKVWSDFKTLVPKINPIHVGSNIKIFTTVPLYDCIWWLIQFF